MNFTLSIIVLNWNRARLLDQCLASIPSPQSGEVSEIHIIDNASTDGSVEVIGKYGDRVVPHLMPENRGAEWINDVFDSLDSDLVFILANDKVLLPGWREYVDRAFSTFDDLAQLALHAPAPLDDEVWVVKPADYVHRHGVGLYRSIGNTGLSSVIRRSAVQSANARFFNIPSDGPYKLPDDGRFSADLHSAGYYSAWSDRYYCLNVGHRYDEMKREWDYYKDNYDSKPSLRMEGLIKRIEEFETAPKPKRQSRVLGLEAIPDCRDFAGDLPQRTWSIFGGGSPGLEVIDFAYSLARLLKPRKSFICRAWTGELLLASCLAAQENGMGTVAYCEPDPELARQTQSLLEGRVSAAPEFRDSCGIPNDTEMLFLLGHADDMPPDQLITLLDSLPESLRHILMSGEFERRFAELLGEDAKARLADFRSLEFPVPAGLTLLVRSGAS